MRSAQLRLVLSIAVVTIAGCGPVSGTTGESVTQPTRMPAPETPLSDTATDLRADSNEGEAECRRQGGVSFREDAATTLERIGSDGSISVYAAEYPLPGPTDGLWSQWGQGVIARNGLHYSGVGDHRGPDGNSYLFEYDPTTRVLTRFMDVLSVVDHSRGAWGYGKLHSQMVEDHCESLWLFTYWGTRSGLEYGDGYGGDLLLEVDVDVRSVRNHGALAGRRGVPSLIGVDDGRLLVAEAVDPETDDGDLVVIDTASVQRRHVADDAGHIGFRALGAEPGGSVLYSVDDGSLRTLDPASGAIGTRAIPLPGASGDFLRAATRAVDQRLYGVTQESDTIFALDASGAVTEIAGSDGYTTSLAMTPDGGRLFWLPDAHGGAWRTGAAVRALDTSTGTVERVVSLAPLIEDSLGLRAGGTYSVNYADGRLILGVNASPIGDDSGFGTVVLVAIEGL